MDTKKCTIQFQYYYQVMKIGLFDQDMNTIYFTIIEIENRLLKQVSPWK